MAFLVWNENYSVGVKELDAQHQMLFNYINELHDAMKAGKSKDIISSTLQKLSDYARVHFTAEEKMMEQKKYPDLAKHKTEHMKFFEKVTDYQMNFNHKSFMTSLEIMDFLKNWLMGHILDTDKKYTPYMK